ncbi:MAG: thioredoxin domain-containing protein, partial [Gammaproteobacteria bacterium]
QAGWPLHVALTPDGYPLVALLYQPPEAFEKFLRDLAARWEDDATELQAVARDAARQAAAVPPALPARPDAAELRSALRKEALAQADELAGGFGAQSKFPKAPQLLALLEVQAHAPDTDLAAFLRVTLDQMAGQGLRDHLGGGFFRYTEDPDWQTPHFEKMLYDNALLARVYLRAARVLDAPGYLEIARETLEFIRRELAAPGGGYYAALSALDAAGEEGGYYLWDRQELRTAAGADWELLRAYWGLDRPAPFAGGHLPIPRMSRAQLAVAVDLPQAAVEARLDAVLIRLRDRRAQRRLPVGTQVLAAWNGLLLSALAEAVATLDGGDIEGAHGRAAAALERFLLNDLRPDDRLVRLRAGTGTPLSADLEDYAYVVAGLQDWQAVRGGRPGATVAALLRQAWQRFHVDGRWRLGEDALLRWDSGVELLADGPLPAPPAVLLAASRRAGLGDLPVRPALNGLMPWVARQPFEYASYVALFEP